MTEKEKEFIRETVKEVLSANTPCVIDTEEKKKVHRQDHEWIKFWRSVSESTAFRAAQALVWVLVIAAFALLLNFKIGPLPK